MVLLTLGLKMYKRIPFSDNGIAETLVGMAISLAYQAIVRRAQLMKMPESLYQLHFRQHKT
jgi:hypothetical protein